MKTPKGIREHDADELRKAKRLDPIRKSGIFLIKRIGDQITNLAFDLLLARFRYLNPFRP